MQAYLLYITRKDKKKFDLHTQRYECFWHFKDMLFEMPNCRCKRVERDFPKRGHKLFKMKETSDHRPLLCAFPIHNVV